MSKALVACLIVLGALALTVPSTALAGGPSAGDQQYIDPLAGSGHHGSSHSHGSGNSSTAPATSPAPTTSATPSVSSSSTSSSTVSASTTATRSTAHDPSKGLPMTGFDALLAAFVGVFLVASGVLLHRAARGT
jgi:hypothetical protein